MLFTTLATVVLAAASSVFAAPHNLSGGSSSHVSLSRRNCHQMPSSVDPNMRNIIYREIKKKTSDDKIMLITMVTAYVESMVNNLNCGDQDSLGLFQQRPSMGWGTPQQLQTPTYAINKFYEALMQVYPGMRTREPGEIAQTVQRAEAGNQYTRNIGTAQRLVREAAAAVGDVSSGNNNNNNNDDDGHSSPAPKPTPTKSNGGGGAINVGSNPSATPSAHDNDDDENCDDSLEPCTQFYVPGSGDNCYKVSAQFGLTLKQFYQLNPELDNTCSNLYTGRQYCVKASDV